MMTISPLEEAIERCKDWTADTETALKQRVSVHSGKLRKSINGKVRVKNLEPTAIAFSFERYGAWLEKGAGKGAGGMKGSTWYDKFGKKKRTNPLSRNKMGRVREERPWFDPTIEDRLPVLGQLISRHLSDSIVKYVGMR